MKVQQEINNNVEYIGEIRENKVGIDVENIDFIATLLTSNLYSKPFESFLRETISNAYDSHVEAKTDHPIILMIESKSSYAFGSYYSKDPYNISVRDYGVGISPERFQKIYTNIGSSTKRESNAYIGGWGIGRFAALSCCDNVQINSYYNGVKYSYIMYKNGTGINIDKISETPGDYKQGVEICINNIELSSEIIREAISKLIFFDNLVIHGSNIQSSILNNAINSFNNRKVDKLTNLASCDYSYIDSGVYAKVGNVLYKIEKDTITHKLFEGYNNFIALECPIGSVNVTPNREQLQYTDKTIKKLKEVLDKAAEELNNKAMKRALQNFPNINAAYNFYVNSSNLKLASRISFNVPTLLDFSDLIVRGNKIPQNIWRFIQYIKHEDIPEILVNDIFNKQPRRFSKKYLRYSKLMEYKVAIKCEDRIKRVTKDYYCDNNRETTIVIAKANVNKLLKHIIQRTTRANTLSKTTALKALSFILKNYKYYELQNDKVPQSYISTYKAKTTKRKPSDKIEIRRYNPHSGYQIYDFEQYLRYYLFDRGSKKKLREGVNMVVYSQNTKEDTFIRVLRNTFYDKKIEFITLKKEHLSSIPKSKIFISLENFLTLYQKILAKAATAQYLKDKFSKSYIVMGNQNRSFPSTKLAQEYNTYLYKYGVSTSNEDIVKLLKQYQDNKWLDWAAIIKFSLSDNDVKRLTQRQALLNLNDITDSLLYIIKGRYSKDDQFGIKPSKRTILLLNKLLRK